MTMDMLTATTRFIDLIKLKGSDSGTIGDLIPPEGLTRHTPAVGLNPKPEELADIETVRNPDGSFDITIKDKNTGEITGEMHGKPGRDGQSATVTAKDKYGTEATLDVGWTEHPDGSITVTTEHTVGGETRSGSVTVRPNANGGVDRVEITLTDPEGNTETGTFTPAEIQAARGPETKPAPDGANEPAEGRSREPRDGVGSTGNGGMGGVKAT